MDAVCKLVAPLVAQTQKQARQEGPPTTAKTDKLPKSNFLHAAQPIKTSIDISSQRSSFFPSVFYLPSHDLLQKNYIHFKYLYVHWKKLFMLLLVQWPSRRQLVSIPVSVQFRIPNQAMLSWRKPQNLTTHNFQIHLAQTSIFLLTNLILGTLVLNAFFPTLWIYPTRRRNLINPPNGRSKFLQAFPIFKSLLI